MTPNTLPVQPKLLTEKVSDLPSQALVLNSVHFTSLKKKTETQILCVTLAVHVSDNINELYSFLKCILLR